MFHPTANRKRFGPLDCIVVDGGPQPSVPVVICHGYGASWTDLAPLSGEWIGLLGDDASRFRFVFPNAPDDLTAMGMPGGRAWWPINMQRLMEMSGSQNFDELHEETPPGIEDAREALRSTVEAVLAELKDAASTGDDSRPTPLILGGFSQGAMVCMDLVLSGDCPAPPLLLQFSGTLLCAPKWRRETSRLAGTTVFQSHGRVDPILPFSGAEKLRDAVAESAADYHFHSFQGPHTIDPESIAKTAVLMSKVTS